MQTKLYAAGLITPAFKRCCILSVMVILTGIVAVAGNQLSGNPHAGMQPITVTGSVADENNEPIPGVNVRIDGTTTGVVTNIEGFFTIQVPGEDAVLIFSFIGYSSQKVTVGTQRQVLITLKEDTHEIDEVVVVGYGTQRKATLTGAVSSVNNKELSATKNQNTQNMLTGKVAGVRVIQKTSEPGEFNNQFDIRGFGTPLIVIDGVPRGNDSFARLSPEEIESISVLKDASAAVYGVKAANGVVLVTTRKGQQGKAKINYSGYYGIQFPADLLKPVGAVDRMILFNEKTMRNLTNPELTYTDEQIEEYLSGGKTSTDWYKETLRNVAPQQQHNISVSGGGDKVDYFINMSYSNQQGFFKSKDLNYDKYNLRSSINAQITERLKVSLNLNGIMDTKNRPYLPIWEIYGQLWRSIPNEPVYANNNPDYYNRSASDIWNVVAVTDSDVSGYVKNIRKMFQSNVGAEWDIPYITGLSAKGMFSFDMTMNDNTSFKKAYNEYNYDAATNVFTPRAKNTPTDLTRYYSNSQTRLWQLSLNYDRTFAQKHRVGALILYEETYSKGDNIRGYRQYTIPLPYLFAGSSQNQSATSNINDITEYASRGLVGRLNYDFAGKYLAEFSFRYDGSSKFPESKRWGFFPGGSVGWRLSEESFIKDNIPFLQNLKIRASYGELGDDSAVDYQFLGGYDYPNTSGDRINKYPTGYMFDGIYNNALGFRIIPNSNITWYTSRTFNIGLDADMWAGLLGLSFDLFQRNRDGLLADRLVTVPGTFGSLMPQENINSDQTKGVELELRHRNVIHEVGYHISGNIAMTRTKRRHVEKARPGNSYDNWRNNTNDRYNDIWFGYGDAGRYTSYEQIANSGIFTGNSVLPGDYIYEDWNGDGTIDDMDRYPIATTTDADKSNFQDKRNYPLMNFGLTLGVLYKGFDLNLLFQGSAMSYVAYGEQISAPLLWNGNALDLLLDRWHPEDPKKDPYDPNNTWVGGHYSYGGTTPDSNSRFAIQNGAYLRLKSIELGYSLPASLIGKIGLSNVRVYVNAYNLFTITGVKGIDPERPTELYGYMYPLNKTVNFGLNIGF